jgi:hypothetical protein
LRSRRQEVRDVSAVKFTPSSEPPKDVTVAGASAPLTGEPPPTTGLPKPKPKPPTTPVFGPPGEEGNFTNRLLAAKRRARQELADGADKNAPTDETPPREPKP